MNNEPSLETIVSEFRAREEARNSIAEADARATIETYFRAFFANAPVVSAVRWEQFTPYFNDGDTCTFNVYSDGAIRFDGEEDFSETWDLREVADPARKAAVELLRSTFPDLARAENAFLTVFGDHAQITATREGFEVTEYSHD